MATSAFDASLVTEVVDHLRTQFFLCAKMRPVQAIASEIGLDRATLGKFIQGRSVSLATLQAIEAWVITQSPAPTHS